MFHKNYLEGLLINSVKSLSEVNDSKEIHILLNTFLLYLSDRIYHINSATIVSKPHCASGNASSVIHLISELRMLHARIFQWADTSMVIAVRFIPL